MGSEKTLDQVLIEHECLLATMRGSHGVVVAALEAETNLGPALVDPLAQNIREGLRDKYREHWKTLHAPTT